MMSRCGPAFAVTVALSLALPSLAAAHETPKEPYTREEAFLKDIGFDQKLGAEVPLDLAFRDETGKAVTLGSYFGTRPIILVLTYYNCTMLCPVLMDGLIRALRPVPLDMGKQYAVLAVSIDPRETPPIAAKRKELYIQRSDRGGAAEGWHFLTGKEAAIGKLAQAVGFRYVYDATRDEFAHAAGVVILTPGGKVSRYFYGVEFAPRDLRLGLVEAAGNTIGTSVDQVLLYCYHYDPLTGTYGIVIMNVLRLAGSATVLVLAGFLLLMVRRERRAAMRPGEAR
jgi:protein SCO1/2